MANLSGKTALVTGGSRGIGAAIARELAARGANIALTYSRSEAKAQQVATECRNFGVEAEAIRADAADPEAIKGLVDRIVNRFGQLDILVNNAAIFIVASLEDCSDDDFQKIVDINIRAVFLIARAAAKIMPSGGRIINMGSASGESSPFPNESLYTMSKFAIAGFTRGWARDLGPKGITVNCIQPGPIATDIAVLNQLWNGPSPPTPLPERERGARNVTNHLGLLYDPGNRRFCRSFPRKNRFGTFWKAGRNCQTRRLSCQF
jgi:3-oxoacyl-[acyl-carrier protein] reductase